MDESTYSKGHSFENKVATLYEALGFDVKRNANVSGHQIDIIVSKYFAGIGLLSCMVEVKSRRSNLGINDLTNFINTATHLIHDGSVQNAVCVTNANFSQDARLAAASKASIRLLTYRELEKGFIQL